MWHENQTEKKWGFAAFLDPSVDEDEKEEYDSRIGAALMWAKDAVGCGGPIGAKWRMQYLDWPYGGVGDGGKLEGKGSTKSAGDAGEDRAVDDQTPDESEAFPSDLSLLRERFCALRDRALNRKRTIGSNAGTIELEDGLLHSVFLLVTRPRVDSVISRNRPLNGDVDDMWVWAIDPDHEASSSRQSATTEYQGYVRVRLQQLVNNFFEARRFHEDEYSMRQLWDAAQRGTKQAFTSLKDAEAELYTTSRDVGSALRPPGSKKYITSPDDLRQERKAGARIQDDHHQS